MKTTDARFAARQKSETEKSKVENPVQPDCSENDVKIHVDKPSHIESLLKEFRYAIYLVEKYNRCEGETPTHVQNIENEYNRQMYYYKYSHPDYEFITSDYEKQMLNEIKINRNGKSIICR